MPDGPSRPAAPELLWTPDTATVDSARITAFLTWLRYWLPLFVVLAPGQVLDEALRARIVETIRRDASPRHVPDDVIQVPGIPHTLTGKKLEVPVKRVLLGRPAGIDPDAVDNANLLDVFAELRRVG